MDDSPLHMSARWTDPASSEAVSDLMRHIETLQVRLMDRMVALDRLADRLAALTSRLSRQIQVGTELADMCADIRLSLASSRDASASARTPMREVERLAGGIDAIDRKWCSCPVALVLPRQEVEAMWDRARQWSMQGSGRFGVANEALLLWSAPSREFQPWIVGFATIDWNTPTGAEATISRLTWQDDLEDGIAQVWRMLEVLAGTPLTAVSGRPRAE